MGRLRSIWLDQFTIVNFIPLRSRGCNHALFNFVSFPVLFYREFAKRNWSIFKFTRFKVYNFFLAHEETENTVYLKHQREQLWPVMKINNVPFLWFGNSCPQSPRCSFALRVILGFRHPRSRYKQTTKSSYEITKMVHQFA